MRQNLIVSWHEILLNVIVFNVILCDLQIWPERWNPPSPRWWNDKLCQNFGAKFSDPLQSKLSNTIHSFKCLFSVCTYMVLKMNHKKEIDRHSLMVHGTHEKFMSYIEIKDAILKFLLKDAVKNLGVLS